MRERPAGKTTQDQLGGPLAAMMDIMRAISRARLVTRKAKGKRRFTFSCSLHRVFGVVDDMIEAELIQ